VTVPGRRVAVVTGGSRGVGAAICRRLATDGMSVHLVYQNAENAAQQVAGEIEAATGRVTVHKADISNEVEVQTLIQRVVDQDGAVNVLVNNAGIIDDQLLELISLAQWEHVLRVNLTGSFLTCRAVIPLMIDQGWGRIINISSNSVRIPSAGQSAYAASKGGLEALTRCLAVEVGRKGIRVNAIAPGALKTDMTAALSARLGTEDANPRWGTPQDVSGIVGFLASDEADYIQGQTITVDGGRLVMRQRAAKGKV
jgi:3-oxoacyl-[acyl-carrier protein] reductase